MCDGMMAFQQKLLSLYIFACFIKTFFSSPGLILSFTFSLSYKVMSNLLLVLHYYPLLVLLCTILGTTGSAFKFQSESAALCMYGV